MVKNLAKIEGRPKTKIIKKRHTHTRPEQISAVMHPDGGSTLLQHEIST